MLLYDVAQRSALWCSPALRRADCLRGHGRQRAHCRQPTFSWSIQTRWRCRQPGGIGDSSIAAAAAPPFAPVVGAPNGSGQAPARACWPMPAETSKRRRSAAIRMGPYRAARPIAESRAASGASIQPCRSAMRAREARQCKGRATEAGQGQGQGRKVWECLPASRFLPSASRSL